MTKCIHLPIFAALAVAANTALALPVLPDFSAATFINGAPINNPYFPMLDSKTRIFEGSKEENGETITEGFELQNVGPGRVLLGVQTSTQLDRAFEEGLLVEETRDYYAQDTNGNVWYFGSVQLFRPTIFSRT